MHARKRRRPNAYTEPIPLGNNDFIFGRSQEVIAQGRFTKTAPISPQKGSKSWIKVAYWEPEDRTDFALDPKSDHDQQEDWNSAIYPDEPAELPSVDGKPKTKKKSLQSVSSCLS